MCCCFSFVLFSSNTSNNVNATSTATASSTDEAQPLITMPASPKSSSSPAASITSHVPTRRGLRNQILTPRRPLRTPTSSPLTMSGGFDIITPRSRFVKNKLKRKHFAQIKKIIYKDNYNIIKEI